MLESFLEKIDSFFDQPCLASGGRTFSCRRVASQANDYYRDICHIPRGSVVGAYVDYSFHSIALFFALGLNKNIIIPLSEDAAPKHDTYMDVGGVEYTVCIKDDQSVKITAFSPKEKNRLYEKLVAREVAGVVLFSSGSSGAPKGIVHDLNVLLNAYKKKGTSFCTLIFLQMDHIGGINTLFYNLANNGMIVVPDSKSPADVCDAIQKHKVELLPTSPTFLNLMLLSGVIPRYDLSSLKLITYGTEPMPESTLLRIKEALPHVALKQTYGMSETGILKTRSRSDDSLWLKLGGEGFDIQIKDSILWIKSPVSMLGYLNADDPFEEDGYLNTGDRVEQDGEWLKILGRDSEMINVGGNKVFPSEVESILHRMPEVDDVVVFGQPNPLTGQAVHAVVKAKHEISVSDFKVVMRHFCKKYLEPYKIPVKVSLSSDDLHTERFKKKRIFKNA